MKKLVFPIILSILFLPFIWRVMAGNPTLPGAYSYHFIYQGIPLVYYWAGLITLGIVYAALFSRLLKIHGIDHIVSSFLLVLTPATLYLSSNIHPYLFALILLLLGLNLLTSRYPYLSFVPFSLLVFFDITAFLSSIIIIVGYLLYLGRKRHLIMLLPLSALNVSLEFYELTIKLPFEQHIKFFSDFGSLSGLGLFVVMLAFIGLVSTWENKRKLLPFYGAFILIMTIHFVFDDIFYFLYPLVVALAAAGSQYLIWRNWSLNLVRILTLTVLFYGVIFSGMAFMSREVDMPPDEHLLESLAWLKSQGLEGKVLTHAEKAGWLRFYGLEMYQGNATKLLLSRSFAETAAILENQSITSIWIDPQMKQGQVWKEADEGLLFLLRNKRFKKIYEHNGIDIWRFE